MGLTGTRVKMGRHGKKIEEKDGSQTGESASRKKRTPGPRRGGRGNRREVTGESREIPSRKGEARIRRSLIRGANQGEGWIDGLHESGGESRPKIG
jgi:hypothetical protein